MNDINALLGDIKLRLHIEHPSIEECYVFGYECAVQDVQESENPYRSGTTEHEQWMEGWWAGFYGEPPLFDYTVTSAQMPVLEAANDSAYLPETSSVWRRWLKITGALAASAVVGYQVIDLVA
ncbi:MAG: transmission trait enhancer LetE [Legionellaceae bacterium]|nr:transmission trait enhancer LetE [Legionellaceae bacterium]